MERETDIAKRMVREDLEKSIKSLESNGQYSDIPEGDISMTCEGFSRIKNHQEKIAVGVQCLLRIEQIRFKEAQKFQLGSIAVPTSLSGLCALIVYAILKAYGVELF